MPARQSSPAGTYPCPLDKRDYISGHDHSSWMGNILEVWIENGKQPTYGDMRGSKFSPEGYAKRYGSWGQSLLEFKAWIDTQGDDRITTDTLGTVKPARGGRTPGLRLRWNVLQDAGFTCRGCGRSPATEAGVILHVGHIVPFSKGGETIRSNLQVLCERCNLGKSDTQSRM